jgi:hypothetical protein
MLILAFSTVSQKIGMFKLSFYFKLRASKAEHGWVEQQHTLARNCLKYFNSQQFFSKRLQKANKLTWKSKKFQSFNSSKSPDYSKTVLNLFGYNFWPNHSVIFCPVLSVLFISEKFLYFFSQCVVLVVTQRRESRLRLGDQQVSSESRTHSENLELLFGKAWRERTGKKIRQIAESTDFKAKRTVFQCWPKIQHWGCRSGTLQHLEQCWRMKVETLWIHLHPRKAVLWQIMGL